MALHINALPTPPSRTSPGTFSDRADAFLGALPGFVTDANALAAEAEQNATSAANSAINSGLSAINAATSAAEAGMSAAAAVAVSGTDKWISGTTYTAGICVWSPVNYQTYRRKTNGAGTTDPSSDAINWSLLRMPDTWTIITADPNPAAAGAKYLLNSGGAAFSVTLPAAPSDNDTIDFMSLETAAANNITIQGNGKLINAESSMIVDIDHASFALVYAGAMYGWRIKQ